VTDAILALNAGSSSIKFALAPAADGAAPLLSGLVDRIGATQSVLSLAGPDGRACKQPVTAADHGAALAAIGDAIAARHPDLAIRGVGHRIVHGGADFAAPVTLTPAIRDALRALVPLAPLHQPAGLAGIDTAAALYPAALQVACFDTAFHAGKPWVHTAMALPAEYQDAGLRRYGFHGLACQSVCRTLRAHGYPLDDRAIVIAHLGNGCSVTALQRGRPVTSSMGFSALDGLVMGTRCGRIDPGAILHLLRQGMDVDALEDLLYRRSGLLGLSGLSNDMRDLDRADTDAARRAIEMFTMRAIEEIARCAGAMGGLDAIVFSGGIGENAGAIRDAIARGLAFLPGRDGAGLEIRICPAREEDELLRSVRAAMSAGAHS